MVLDSVFVSVPGEDVVLIVVFDSVLLEVAGEGLTIVVLLSFFSAGGVTVVSFCSQATRSAAPARTQMYFFINCRNRIGLAELKLIYGVGEGDDSSGDVVVVVVDSVGLVARVASGEAAGLAAGAVVSVFCSQAASSAAPVRMQMYFFIDFGLRSQYWVNDESEQVSFSALHQIKTAVRMAIHAHRPPHGRSASRHVC